MESHSACIHHTRAFRLHTCKCHNHKHMCQDYSRVYFNHNLRVKLPVRFVIILFSVIFTRIRVKINLVCVYTTRGSPTRACFNNIRAFRNHTAYGTHSAFVNHTWACRYNTRECHMHTHTCQNYSRVCVNHTLRVKPNSACGNYNQFV
jgi:hypothetical protein